MQKLLFITNFSKNSSIAFIVDITYIIFFLYKFKVKVNKYDFL